MESKYGRKGRWGISVSASRCKPAGPANGPFSLSLLFRRYRNLATGCIHQSSSLNDPCRRILSIRTFGVSDKSRLMFAKGEAARHLPHLPASPASPQVPFGAPSRLRLATEVTAVAHFAPRLEIPKLRGIRTLRQPPKAGG